MTENMNDLNRRQKNILRAIIGEFISSAAPVGSKNLKKSNNLKVSPATIRHIMNDLEERGYVFQPHTSAGRVPTDKAYRLYVNELISNDILSVEQQEEVEDSLRPYAVDVESLLSTASSLLGEFTSELGVVIAPLILDGELTGINLYSVASQTVLVVLQLREGFAKTIVLEIQSSLPSDVLEMISGKLNKKLAGLELREIRKTISQRCRDFTNESSGIVKLLIDSADRVFDFSENEKITYSGSANMLSKPEFSDPAKMRNLMKVLENEKKFIKQLQDTTNQNGINITIGKELDDPIISELSFVTSSYKFGHQIGILAVVGPTRMEYKKAISIVNHTAKTLTESFSK